VPPVVPAPSRWSILMIAVLLSGLLHRRVNLA